MKLAHRSLFYGMFMASLVAPTHAAEPMHLVSLEFPPYYTIVEEGKPLSGFSYEILQELARRVGTSTEVEILPVARAVDAMMKTPNWLGTATMTEARKPLFTWIAEVARDQLVIATPKGKRVATLEDLPKDARLGVLLASTMEKLVNDRGFKQVSPVRVETLNLEKLKKNRLDAWLSYASLIKYESSKAGLPLDSFEYSEPVGVFHFYLVTSKETKEEVYGPYRDAFRAMRKDGTYDRIVKKYRGMVTPAE
ncbi:MAG TPA: transporter substrate-binding domain-containing protein [Rhodocyclaceae bacterium]|nr:transporter substrate-binding domain-containing protein [Rhodocyclaceae bacterium]